MCNRSMLLREPETLRPRFGAAWLADRPRDNRFDPRELAPTKRG